VNRAIREGGCEGVVDEAVLLHEREPVETRTAHTYLEVVDANRPILDRDLGRFGKLLLEQDAEADESRLPRDLPR
jgi:hypothetical protein